MRLSPLIDAGHVQQDQRKRRREQLLEEERRQAQRLQERKAGPY